MVCRTELSSWKKLVEHQRDMASVHMCDLFSEDQHRFQRFSLQFNDLLVDFSKNRINAQTLQLFSALLNQVGLAGKIEQMFSGVAINTTEQRPVLHTALRNRSSRPVIANGRNVMGDVREVLEKMSTFSHAIRRGRWRGHTGKKISTIVNIGVGGSDLGPRMVVQALDRYATSDLRMFFISAADVHQFENTLQLLDPETTLFIVTSKSFTTAETMINARTARTWIIDALGSSRAMDNHFVAVSANEAAVAEFGIASGQLFKLWDWVGGRYSLWSAVGLPIALVLGMDRFEELLDGAYAMDNHFRTTSWNENIPVVMALLGVWYNNFFGSHNHAILPYDSRFQLLPAYLQQLDMESNGKSCTRDGRFINYATSPIVWGQLGMDGQHAFFQRLHQGTTAVPCDFLCATQPAPTASAEHHRWQLANCMAQSQALLVGKTVHQICAESQNFGHAHPEAEQLLAHKVFSGNRPSNTLLYRQLTPHLLGSLLSMYEHRTFVQGVIWDINSFDQWGVELGKALAIDLNDRLGERGEVKGYDSSTAGLIKHYRICNAEANILDSSEHR